MIAPVSYAVVALATVLFVVAVYYAVRDKLIDDRLLAVAALVEVGLLVQLVAGLVGLGEIGDSTERATFAAYLVSLPVIPIGTVLLAIKKSRWTMGSARRQGVRRRGHDRLVPPDLDDVCLTPAAAPGRAGRRARRSLQHAGPGGDRPLDPADHDRLRRGAPRLLQLL